MALAVPSSVNLNSSSCQSVGVPDRFVVIDVIAAFNPVNSIMSTLSELVVGVAPGAFVVTNLLVILLFVSVFVLDIDGITTHSTANTQAAPLLNVVSVAAHSSIVPQVIAFDVPTVIAVLNVNNAAECVIVALPLLKFITPHEAKNKSENIRAVVPSAAPSLVVGVNPVVIVADVNTLLVNV